MLLEQPTYQLGGDAHQCDGQDQTKSKGEGMPACGAGDGQNVVEGHRDVRHHDPQDDLAEGLAMGLACDRAVAFEGMVHRPVVASLLMLGCRVNLAPHLPADPKEKNAASERKPEHLQQLRCDPRAQDPQSSCRKNADCDRTLALLKRQAGRGKTDDESVVSSQHEVDEDDLNQGADRLAADETGHDGSCERGP